MILARQEVAFEVAGAVDLVALQELGQGAREVDPDRFKAGLAWLGTSVPPVGREVDAVDQLAGKRGLVAIEGVPGVLVVLIAGTLCGDFQCGEVGDLVLLSDGLGQAADTGQGGRLNGLRAVFHDESPPWCTRHPSTLLRA